MFIGHFGPAGLGPQVNVKLWHGFVAVQLVDFVWIALVLLGIEKMVVVEGATSVHHYHATFIGYSHSLVTAVFYGLIAGTFYRFVNPGAGRKGAVFIGLLVVSHWVLDLLTHLPDLQIWPGSFNVGFGLWHYFLPSIAFEFVLFGLGIWYFIKQRTTPLSRRNVIGLVLLVTVASLLQIVGYTSGPPVSVAVGVTSTFFVLSLLTALAWLCD